MLLGMWFYLVYVSIGIQVSDGCLPIPSAPITPSKAPNSTAGPSSGPSASPSAGTAAPLVTTTVEKITEPLAICKTTGHPNSGRLCNFPFLYEGKVWNVCAPYKNKFWCSFQFVYNSRDWGYCDPTVCPTIPGSITTATTTNTTQTTTTTTATTTTTSTTTTTTTTTMLEWEAGKTSVDIANEENTLTCEISLEFNVDKGIHTRNTASTCSASGTVEDPIPTFGNQTFHLTSGSGLSISCSLVAVLLEDNLSEEVLGKTLKCQVINDQCVTLDGAVFPSQCQIPFIKNGKKFKGCTNYGSPDPNRLWCPTEVNKNSEAKEGRWGYCNDRCGYCAGADVEARKEPVTDCGYSCFINMAKEMEPKNAGMEPSLLPPPTLTYKKNTLTAWNKLPNNQFRFLQGQPGVFLTCKNGFNHFACHQDIFINCTGNYRFSAYRATVDETTMTIHEKIADDVANTHLGCATCPGGFEYKEGYQSRTYQTSLGDYDGVPDESQCKNKCEALKCQTFAFSPKRQSCKLHANKVTNPSKPKYKDYKMCVKDEACFLALQGPIEPALSCSSTKNAKIANGKEADRNKHPWMAYLAHPNSKQIKCGGSLIGKKWVLSAAHCKYKETDISDPYRHVPIFFGVHDKKDLLNSNDLKQSNIQVGWVDDQHHPQKYKPGSGKTNPGNLAEDILLLHLSDGIDLNAHIKLIKLPGNGFQHTIQMVYTLYGWGATEFCYDNKPKPGGIKAPDILQELELEIHPPIVCHAKMDTALVKNWYEQYLDAYAPVVMDDNDNGFTKGWKFCAQSGKSGAGCYGDSGSPLVYRNTETGTDYVVGVLSHGTDCNRALLGTLGVLPTVSPQLTQAGYLPSATVFADVRYFESWISNVVLNK